MTIFTIVHLKSLSFTDFSLIGPDPELMITDPDQTYNEVTDLDQV